MLYKYSPFTGSHDESYYGLLYCLAIKSNVDTFYIGINYGGRGQNSGLGSFTRDDSLLLRCLVRLEHILSG